MVKGNGLVNEELHEDTVRFTENAIKTGDINALARVDLTDQPLGERDAHFLLNDLEEKLKKAQEAKDNAVSDINAITSSPDFKSMTEIELARLQTDVMTLRAIGGLSAEQQLELARAQEEIERIEREQREEKEKQEKESKEIQSAVMGGALAFTGLRLAGANGGENSDNNTSGGNANGSQTSASARQQSTVGIAESSIAVSTGEKNQDEKPALIEEAKLETGMYHGSGVPTTELKGIATDQANLGEHHSQLDAQSIAELRTEYINAAKLAVTEHFGWANVTPGHLDLATKIAGEKFDNSVSTLSEGIKSPEESLALKSELKEMIADVQHSKDYSNQNTFAQQVVHQYDQNLELSRHSFDTPAVAPQKTQSVSTSQQAGTDSDHPFAKLGVVPVGTSLGISFDATHPHNTQSGTVPAYIGAMANPNAAMPNLKAPSKGISVAAS